MKFDSNRYGFHATLPDRWQVMRRETDDTILVCLASQAAFQGRPALVRGELSLAPESLHIFQSRLAQAASRSTEPGSRLTRNVVVPTDRGPRLETIRLHTLLGSGEWVERGYSWIANRQMYVLKLLGSVNSEHEWLPELHAVVESLEFTQPEIGSALVDQTLNRWRQTEFHFSMNLPSDWRPVLAPMEIALFYATAPARGVWADNALVIAHEPANQPLDQMAQTLPAQLRAEEPGCEVIQCRVIPQAGKQALETIVRTQRGPFSMTVLERRFSGERFDYEVKFTLETERFDPLLARLRDCLDSFQEEVGVTPGTRA